MQEDTIREILAENEKRWKRLRAEYDPLTGEGLAELLGMPRVKLEIADFALPVQWVPPEMMKNKLIREVAKYGSIADYIAKKKWKYDAPDFVEVERRIRESSAQLTLNDEGFEDGDRDEDSDGAEGFEAENDTDE